MKRKTMSKKDIPIQISADLDSGREFFFLNKNAKYYLILVVVIFYGNTLFNNFAFDDELFIVNNKFTLQGFAGIPKVWSQDSFAGYFGENTTITGGRYRPVYFMLFCIEYGLYGLNPFLSHLINLLLYVGLILWLYKLFKEHLFKKFPLISFITVLIFAIHPIHTEAVSNIKSRDEIMSFFFIILSIYYLFEGEKQHNNTKGLVLSLIFYFLSLLSKESTIVFVLIIPMLYWFFRKSSMQICLKRSIPFIIATIVYLGIRFSIIGFPQSKEIDILNFPYMYAGVSEAFATKIYVLLKYIQLLIFPHPMSYDYCFNQIPYVSLISPQFIISAFLLIGLAVIAVLKFKERSIYSFSILYFFITISLVSNFFINLGAPLADRLLFQPSLSFAIIFAFVFHNYVIGKDARVAKKKREQALFILILLVIFSGVKTISRNLDWKNTETLFLADINAASNSAKVNDNYAITLLRIAQNEKDEAKKRELLLTAVKHSSKAIQIHPRYLAAYMNLGLEYFNLLDLDNTYLYWMKAKQFNSNNALLKTYLTGLSGEFLAQGAQKSKENKIPEAIELLNKSVNLNELNLDAWYNLGGNYLLISDTVSARNCWNRTVKINPQHNAAKDWLMKIGK